MISSVFSSSLLPAFSGRAFLTTTDSSATCCDFRGFLNSFLSPPTTFHGSQQASPVTALAPRRPFHPQTHPMVDQVLGFSLFCTITPIGCRIRFTYAMYRLLPIASFRPNRCQLRPCDSDYLPPDQGDTCFFQQVGFASFAGQTKKRTA